MIVQYYYFVLLIIEHCYDRSIVIGHRCISVNQIVCERVNYNSVRTVFFMYLRVSINRSSIHAGCWMVLTRNNSNSSEPDSDPEEIKNYEDLPFEATSSDDTEVSDLEQNKGKLWYCQATKTWRSGDIPQEEDVSSPMVNQWRSQNEGLDSSSSSDEDSEDFDSIPGA